MELFSKLKPIFGRKIDELWLLYSISDIQTKREIEGILKLLAAKYLNRTYEEKEIPLEPPEIDGDYELGEIIYAGRREQFRLKEKHFLNHIGYGE